VYLLNGFEQYGALLAELGPHSLGRACLDLQRVDDVDLAVMGG
jgi:hypothetical protein